MRVVFVHGACVRDGAWWWSRVNSLLAAGGTASVAVRLPSCGELPDARRPAGLDDDVEETRRVLRDAGPAILVGHSYGGVVATAAADAGDVRHLVYVSSFLPDVGESLADLGPAGPAPHLEFSPDGTFAARSELAAPLFLHDCDPAAVDGALARLVRQDAAVLTTPVRYAGWRSTPSTAVVCAGDRATPPEVQRAQATRAGRTVELATGHHPMLSHPDLLAALLRKIAAERD
ncbi:Pimeloyl-ACP methyl ester carboxylesterase [Micromonospora matsumotoense]|uniref:Pimeloyl-ACP methyl ester carboxylesterase n=1 Tax=Micromonospora matsumotoense TaxID=121616 RepID=A0A1C4ZHA0_9ACTN|nr:alpha/beta hydrolase [Micromonospora matsumotoense]SCF32410.1 Pimeloyl-ACP methyl ester carboxylesterase [Micromonospora matsumotoense]